MMEQQQTSCNLSKRLIPNILVTGTPGTGKTTLSTLLNQSLQFIYINIGQLVIQKQLYKQWDNNFNVPIFDQDMVLDYLQDNYDINKGGLLIDFHSSDFFPIRYFDLVILMRCQNKYLYDRLYGRGYNENKIKQNIDCQILQVTHDQVYQAYSSDIILQIYNQEKQDMEKNVNGVIQWLQNWKYSRQIDIKEKQNCL